MIEQLYGFIILKLYIQFIIRTDAGMAICVKWVRVILGTHCVTDFEQIDVVNKKAYTRLQTALRVTTSPSGRYLELLGKIQAGAAE